MSLVMGEIKPENPELFAPEFGKIAESDFVYTLASTNTNQSAPNLVKMYVTIISWISLIMDLIYCLVVLWFNAMLTAKVISWQSVTHMCFPGFLTPVLTQLFSAQ